MSTYERMGAAVSIADLLEAQKRQLSPYTQDPFKWKSEYLPFIIGFVGIIGLGFTMKIIRKKRKKKK